MNEEAAPSRKPGAFALALFLLAWLYLVWMLDLAASVKSTYASAGVSLPVPTVWALQLAELGSLLGWLFIGVVVASLLWYFTRPTSVRLRRIFLGLALLCALLGALEWVALHLPMPTAQRALQRK